MQVTGTLPISYQWRSNGIAIPGANLPTLTVVGGAAATQATYVLSAVNAIGSTNTQPIVLTFANPNGAYASAVLKDRPSSYWRLGESSGTVAVDSAGYNDATYSGSVVYGVASVTSADTNTAVQFIGGNAPAPYSSTLNSASAFTVECYVKPTQDGQNSRAVFGSQNRNVGRSGYVLYQGLNGNFWESHIGDGTTVRMFLQGTTPVVAGQWYHLAVVYDPNDATANGRLYVNGVQESALSGCFPSSRPLKSGGFADI
ncbi:MAG: LamG domain-containing protein [Verrucomicrobiota bacterium]